MSRAAVRACALSMLLTGCVTANAPVGLLLSTEPYIALWVDPEVDPTKTKTFWLEVRNDTGHSAEFDFSSYLRDQIRQRLVSAGLKEAIVSDPRLDVASIQVSVRLYQEGSVLGRWLGGRAGAAYCVTHTHIRRPRQQGGAEIVVVTAFDEGRLAGGLLSAGMEKTVLEEAAEALAKTIFLGARS